MKMIILDKILKIYEKYYICTHCLGRMFSLLGTSTTNLERGTSLLLTLTLENHRNLLSGEAPIKNEGLNTLKLLAEKARFKPTQKVLENEGYKYSLEGLDIKCFLCNNLFQDTEKYIEEAQNIVANIEFGNLLVGTNINPQIVNREDIFKGEFQLLEAESFKSHFNRTIGKELSSKINIPPEFNNPDIVLVYHLLIDSFKIELIHKSLFIYGRYSKLIRGIPQTRWPCRTCKGKGCKECNYTGKQYQTSVEEFINPEFIKETKANDSKFHGAGREDIDVRMLGTGRPFIIELKNPKIRSINLEAIMERVNKVNDGKVMIRDVRYSNKKEVISIKQESENTRKVYQALIESEKEMNENTFKEFVEKLKLELEDKFINQRTPIRVAHRRADKIREKCIFSIEGKYLTPTNFEFTIDTQGGTYIKELIHGDEGRTIPSFAGVLGSPLTCKELDVLKIDH